MPRNDHPLTVSFELLGKQETTRIKSWSIESAYLTSTDGFSFSILTDPTDPSFRDLELQPVELILDGSSQLLGRIERTSIGSDGVAVECQGRDYIADLVECNVDPTFKVKESMTLGDAILRVSEPCGIQAVLGDDDVALQNIRSGVQVKRKKRKQRQKTPLQDYQPRPGGEGIYEFGNRLTARHGVTIQPGGDRGVIVLNAPDYEQSPTYSIRVTSDKRAGSSNNVIEATATRDYTKFPTYTLANGKQARTEDKPTALRRTYDMLTLASAFSPEMQRILTSAKVEAGRKMPNEPRGGDFSLYRLLHVQDIDARSEDQLDFCALRAIADRLKDTLEYSCTLRGHVDPGSNAIWSVNTMVHVVDEIRGIDEPLWISECSKSFSPSAGAITRITCWRPSSFQIEPK